MMGIEPMSKRLFQKTSTSLVLKETKFSALFSPMKHRELFIRRAYNITPALP